MSYLPSESGWVNYNSPYGYFKLRMVVNRSYNALANTSTFTVSLQAKSDYIAGNFKVMPGGTVSIGGSTVYTFTDYPRAHYVNMNATWRDVAHQTDSSLNTFSATLSHDAAGYLSVDFAVNLQLYFYYDKDYFANFNNSATLNFSEARGSTIASFSSAVQTNESFALTVSRSSDSYWHKASFGSFAVSEPFESTLSYTVPRSWFENYVDTDEITVPVSVQTYTDSGCTTALGSAATCSFTLTADSGMVPTLGEGAVTLSPYNVGKVQGMNGYIQGYSRAEAVFDATKIVNAVGAAISSYSLSWQGGAASSAPYRSGVISAQSTMRCTVTDSRGRSAYKDFQVSPMEYAPPRLSGVSVYRGDSTGAENEDGTVCCAKAGLLISPLNGQNSGTLTVTVTSQGTQVAQRSIPSAQLTSVCALESDKSYTVIVVGTDTLGNSVRCSVEIPSRAWVFKLTESGDGLAVGKAAERANCLEIRPDWSLMAAGATLSAGELSAARESAIESAFSAASGSSLFSGADASMGYFGYKGASGEGSFAICFGADIGLGILKRDTEGTWSVKTIKW